MGLILRHLGCRRFGCPVAAWIPVVAALQSEIDPGGGTVVIVGDSTEDDEVATGDDTETLEGAEADRSEAGETDAAGAPTRFEKVRRSSAGVVMTGIALGLQDAFELPRKEPAFVIKAAGEPDGEPGPIDLQFDPDDPANTVAVIRPWLADGPKKDPPPS